MADIWVRGTGGSSGSIGSDAAAGTRTAPLATLAAAFTLAATYPTAEPVAIYADGRFHERDSTLSKANAVLQAWPGVSIRPQVRGDVIIAAGSSWTNTTGSEYTFNIGTGKTLYGVAFNYGVLDGTTLRVLSDGGWYGHLTSGTAGSLSASQYAYNSGTGVLTVRLSNGADPTTGTVSYCLSGNGVVVSGSNSGVMDMDGVLFMDWHSNNGYGFQATGDKPFFSGLRTYDTGYHPVGARGTTTTQCRIFNCTNWGANNNAGSGASNGSFVMYGDDASNDVSGVGQDCVNYLRAPIKEDGTTFTHSLLLDGFHTHSGSNFVGNVVWKRCSVVYSSGGNVGNPFTCGNARSPSDATQWKTYAVRLEECTATGVATWTPKHGMATKRCRIIGDATNYTAASAQQLVKVEGGITFGLFQTELVCNTGSANNFSGVFGFVNTGGNTVVLRDVSVIDNTPAGHSSARYWFRIGTASNVLNLNGVLLQWPLATFTNGYLIGGTVVTLTCANLWAPKTGQVRAAGWHEGDTANDTLAEFSANYTGVYSASAAQFDDATSSAKPLAGGNLFSSRFTVPERRFGINMLRHSGMYGAYQDGRVGANRGRGRGVARASRANAAL